MKQLLVVLLLAVSCPPVIAGDIYKWVDVDGQTHYGERSSGSNATLVDVPQRNTTSAPSGTDQQRRNNIQKWVDARQQEREQEKQEQEELKVKRAAIKRKCDSLRNELKDMEVGHIAWYRLDEAGNRVYYTDEEVEARRRSMRKEIKQHCS